MAEGTAEEREEGMKDEGMVSSSAGSLVRVGVAVEDLEGVSEETGGSSGAAYRLQGRVARRMRMEDREL